jgi:hypothetical protein
MKSKTFGFASMKYVPLSTCFMDWSEANILRRRLLG